MFTIIEVEKFRISCKIRHASIAGTRNAVDRILSAINPNKSV